MRTSTLLNYLGLDSVLSLRKVNVLLLLAEGLSCCFKLGQAASKGSGLLRTQVQWQMLLIRMELLGLASLGMADHSKHSGDVLSHGLYLADLGGRASSDLLHSKCREFLLEVCELLGQFSLVLLSKFICFHLRLQVRLKREQKTEEDRTQVGLKR
jgi:hypothetical protein